MDFKLNRIRIGFGFEFETKSKEDFSHMGNWFFSLIQRRCTNFLDKIQGEISATWDKEKRKRFPRWRFCNYLKLNPNHPIPPINWIWPSHSIHNSRDWRIPNLESTRSKIPNCLGCSRKLGDEPSRGRRPDSLIKRKGAHTPS